MEVEGWINNAATPEAGPAKRVAAEGKDEKIQKN
jgi:hypothetical protein